MLRRALLLAFTLPLATATAAEEVARPGAIVVDGLPPIPQALAASTQPYFQARRAQFLGWNAKDRSMLIRTRFGNTDQVHSVAGPGAARRQVSFEDEPILMGSVSPCSGDAVVVQKDTGGAEFYQLYRLQAGRLRLLSDGRSRNWFGAGSRDGHWLGYSSTRRNGTDSDLYMVDPRDPASDRKVAVVSGGGWNIADFPADGTRALVLNRQSVDNADLYEMDVATGRMRPLVDLKAQVSFEHPRYGARGRIWVASDAGGSDVMRLGTLDASGVFAPATRDAGWDVTGVALSPDGGTVAYTTNGASVSREYLSDTRSGMSPRHRAAVRRDPLRHRAGDPVRAMGRDRPVHVVGESGRRRVLDRSAGAGGDAVTR